MNQEELLKCFLQCGSSLSYSKLYEHLTTEERNELWELLVENMEKKNESR